MDRESTLADFKSDVCNLLIATSVAARGLDVKVGLLQAHGFQTLHSDVSDCCLQHCVAVAARTS